jgi:hypothetical protein
VSFNPGIYNITTRDSFSNTGTTQTTIGNPYGTMSLAPGHGLAAQSLPLVKYDSIYGTTNFLNFPAFPVTT